MKSDYHIPVLLDESVNALVTNNDGLYLDMTFGAGGHSIEILKRLSAKGRLYGFDQDVDAIANSLKDDRFELIHANFEHVKKFMRYYGVDQLDGVLADLGVSSYQLDTPDRGFSFRFDAGLDMRMNSESKKTAAIVLNEYPEFELYKVFRDYGEVPNARKLASRICNSRVKASFETIEDLMELVKSSVVGKENKYLAKVFQALRLEVNGEMDVLKTMLEDVAELIKPAGRLVVIAYHSLEDRMVKRLVKTGNVAGNQVKDEKGNMIKSFKEVVKGVVLPSDKEIQENNRARSAKMRIAEKI